MSVGCKNAHYEALLSFLPDTQLSRTSLSLETSTNLIILAATFRNIFELYGCLPTKACLIERVLPDREATPRPIGPPSCSPTDPGKKLR